MRVYVRGVQGTWCGDWWETRPDGTRVRHRESLGLAPPEHGRSDALAELERRVQAQTARAQVEHAAAAAAAGPRLEDIFTAWLRSKRIQHQAKPRTIEALEVAARRFSREWGELAASELTLERLDTFKESRLRSVSIATLNRDLDLLRNALRWAVQRGHLQTPPPVERIRSRRRDVPKLLDRDQVRALLALCTACESEHGTRFLRLEPVVRVALAAGLRAEEARWLSWDDIDLSRSRLTVTAKSGWSPKSSSERSVPLHDSFLVWIQRWRDRLTKHLGRRLLPYDWFAPFLPVEQGRGGGQGTAGQQWVRGVLGQEVRALFEAAEIPPTGRHHLHKLRGTFATRVLEGGGSIEALRQLLGHSDIRTTALYLEATDQARRRAVLAAGWDE